MNQTQAIAKLRKVIGSKMAYRVDPKAPDAEEREASRAAAAIVRDELKVAEEARDARRAAVLAGDLEYQALKMAANDLLAQRDKLHSRCYRKRVTVGRLSGVAGVSFFHQVADGDNWAEVVEKVTAKVAA